MKINFELDLARFEHLETLQVKILCGLGNFLNFIILRLGAVSNLK